MWHILRDRRTTIILLIIPVVLLLLLGFAISTEIRNTPFVVYDQSKTTLSRQLVDKIDGNRFFDMKKYIYSYPEVEETFKQGKVKVAIIIPHDFSNDLYRTGKTDVQIIIDSSDPSEATNIGDYLQLILLDFQQSISPPGKNNFLVNSEIKLQYNPQAKSSYSFVPGLMGTVLLLICAMMTSISIVREKEMGTMEILLVSPLKPRNIVLGKAIPYFVISMVNVLTILLISYFILGVPIKGSLLLVLFLCVIFIFSALSLGLLVSSITETQQLAVLISVVSLMLPSLILSGMIFPLESAPYFLQFLSNFIPAKWFVVALRAVMIKGQGITAIWKELSVLLLMTVVLLGVSISLFKKRL